MTRVGLFSGGYPPDRDGIGDYTYWLARALAGMKVSTSVWTSQGPERWAVEGVKVFPFFNPAEPATMRALPELAAKADVMDWLVVQYNPFGFGKWGYCPWLIDALRGLQRRRIARVAMMFHETQVPKRPWKFRVMRLWQHRQLRQLARLADKIFISSERWIAQLREVHPRVAWQHLVVGSNLPTSSLTKEAARAEIGVGRDTLIIGMFGTAHVSRLFEWMGAAAREARKVHDKVLVLYVGKDGAIFRDLCTGVEFRDEGHLPAETAADRLRAMDLLVSPFDDGLATRRGSAIAGFQHGSAVASTWNEDTDRILREGAPESLILTPCGDMAAFTAAVNRWIVDKWKKGETGSAEMEAFFERYFAWPVIARTMVDGLP